MPATSNAPQPDHVFSPVSLTAVAVAAVRARESARPDALFDDPYAAALVAAYVRSDPASEGVLAAEPGPMGAGLAGQIPVRTRFYDEWLLAADCPQLVLLAAGLDARAYRLPLPPTATVFEVDLPPVLAFKRAALAALPAATTPPARPRCVRTEVAADLADPAWPQALRAAGFDPARRTAWLVEGLLSYLDAEQSAALLDVVGALSAPGSRLALGRGRRGRGSGDDAAKRPVEGAAALWRGGLGSGAEEWLTDHGWTVRAHPLTATAAAYGRDLPAGPDAGFLTAMWS